jgi:G6PDH family F420-dependent oxidoreductase
MEMKIGFCPFIERYGPTDALKQAVEAEKVGFDSIWADDHFLPVPPMTESGFAWTWMSSALQATEKVFFSTGVTAPTMRYNPAIVAQAFATMAVMYPGRVRIGVGSGEELNEVCVLGCDWPSPRERLDMLAEALTVMNNLWTSTEPISFAGKYYKLDNAVILTKPKDKVPVYFSGIGPRASKMAGFYGDHLVTLATDPQLVKNVVFPNFEAGAKEAGKDPKKMERTVMLTYMYDPDRLVDPNTTFSSAEDAKIEVAEEVQVLVASSTEDFIKRVEKFKEIGFDHVVFINMSADPHLGVKIFEDVLPHVV